MSAEKMPVIREKKAPRKGNRKLLLLLFLFFITLLVILFFNSSLSKIDSIAITGNRYVAKEQIGQASGIHVGDQFFITNTESAEERIKSLKLVQSAKITKRFPGRVSIEVKEYPEAAFQISASGGIEIVLANGQSVPLQGDNISINRPILKGWEKGDPLRKKLCRTLSQISSELLADVSEITPIPSRSYPDKIMLYTRSQFQVVTTVQYLPDKIQYLNNIIGEYQDQGITSGEITLLEANSGIPFEKQTDEEKKEEISKN